MIIECVGPRCCKPGISRSTSGITEARNSRGMFTFTFRTLDVALPDMYPKARCPTAYVSGSSNCLVRFNFFMLFDALYLGYICQIHQVYMRASDQNILGKFHAFI